MYIYAHMGRYLETTHVAPGVVVEVVHASESTKKGRMHPVVRFTTVDGREVVGRSEQHHNVQVGQTVQVLYDPKNPEHVGIGTLSQVRNQRIFFTALCTIFGLVVCLSGFGSALAGQPAAGAVPPLDYQIRWAETIVLAGTEVTGGAVAYRVKEAWKGPDDSVRAGEVLGLDIGMHELLGYRPQDRQEVVLFFSEGLPANQPLEVLPVIDGDITYSPHDQSVHEKLTPGELKQRVTTAAATPR